MKKLSLLVVLAMVLSSTALFAAGVGHNINHSAEFIGMMNRNASQEADAAFFNPAGLTSLKDGLYLYLSSQTIWQTRTLKDDSKVSSTPFAVTTDPDTVAINDTLKDEYQGKTFAPVFPNFYAVYKMDKMAFFAAFAPVGGGGTAKFDDGMPAFFWMGAGETIEGLAIALDAYPGTQTATIDKIKGNLEGSSTYLLGQVGVAYEVDPMVSVALGAKYVYAMDSYKGELAVTTTTPLGTSTTTGELKSELTGQCYGAVAGVNLKPMEGLNVGIRYEWYSKLELEADTSKDDFDMYPDGSKTVATLPQVIGLGIGYQILPELATQVSVNYALNKQVKEYKDGTVNAYDLGIGFEYKVMEGLKARLGYLYGKASEKDEANTEDSYGLDSHSFGLGATYTAMPGLDLTLGASYTYYASKKIDSTAAEVAANVPTFNSTPGKTELGKSTYDIAIGVTYKAM